MAFTGTVRLIIDAELTKTLDKSTPLDPLLLDVLQAFTSGTGANQADLLWHDNRVLAASATDDIDLAGVLADAFGGTVTLARVKLFYVKNASALATVTLAAAPAAGWSNIPFAGAFQPGEHRVALSPDATGIAVTAGSADTFRITNNDGVNAASVDIAVAGASS